MSIPPNGEGGRGVAVPPGVQKEWDTARLREWWGIRLESAVEGECRLGLTVREEMVNRDDGSLHGGVIASLIDTSVAVALSSVYEVGVDIKGHTTIELNVSYLAAARTPDVYVKARILRRGRTIVVGEGSVFDQDDKLCATGRATYMVFRG